VDQDEFYRLAQIPPERRKTVDDDQYAMTLSFAFVLSSLWRPALKLARRFIPLPSMSTIYLRNGPDLKEQEANLSRKENIRKQVEVFMRFLTLRVGTLSVLPSMPWQ
jgi:hypothetical protein